MNINHRFLKKIQTIQPEYKEGRFLLNVPSLKYSELPSVSVVTITYNRLDKFDLARYNWKKFKYPKEFFLSLLKMSRHEPDPIKEISIIEKELYTFNIMLCHRLVLAEPKLVFS